MDHLSELPGPNQPEILTNLESKMDGASGDSAPSGGNGANDADDNCRPPTPNCESSLAHSPGRSKSLDPVGMTQLKILRPKTDSFSGEFPQASPLSVNSTVTGTAQICNVPEVTCSDDSKPSSSRNATIDSTPALEQAISVVSISPSNDRLLTISDSETSSDDHGQNDQGSYQDYSRVGDDLGGGPDRDDMSMMHPGNSQQGSQVIPDEAGNLRILVRKTKPLLGIAIEGGANTRHPLPRIININENGAAYDAGGLQVGQLILEVDGHKVEGMHHQEVARLIAESFAQRDKPHIEFLVVEAKKSNLEPKPTALIFLEA